MDAVTVGEHRVDVARAWTSAEVRQAVEELLTRRRASLPEDRGAHVLLKPNLNNDLVALTGNSVDLRVLCAVIEVLQGWGYTRITVADGSNVGVERRGIDTGRQRHVLHEVAVRPRDRSGIAGGRRQGQLGQRRDVLERLVGRHDHATWMWTLRWRPHWRRGERRDLDQYRHTQ